VETEGRLSREAGALRPLPEAGHRPSAAATGAGSPGAEDSAFAAVRRDVIEGDEEAVIGHVHELIDRGLPPQAIIDQGLVAAMDVIGSRFASGEVFIPEVLLSARAMNDAVDYLGPYLADGGGERKGRVLIGTVAGDMHDIGKNMVGTMLKGLGFEVLDLGINVPVEEFVDKAQSFEPDIVGLSALLTTTMTEMQAVIDALKSRNLRNRMKIIVGGAPLSADYARKIGADGFAEDAASAASLAARMVE
jgi:5-methyltetrahydrofolate--homocysteine methyltransferase